jgi:hypothetical protein
MSIDIVGGSMEVFDLAVVDSDQKMNYNDRMLNYRYLLVQIAP